MQTAAPLFSALLLLTASVLFVACGSDEAAFSTEATAPMASPTIKTEDVPTSSPRQVVMVDEGLRMGMYRETIPAGWQVFQKIQSNMQEGGFRYYLRDLYGPNGEIIRDLGNAVYNHYFGLTMDMVLTQAAMSVVEQPQFQQARPSRMLEQCEEVRRNRQGLQAGQTWETWEMPFRGTRDGQPYQGMLYLQHMPYPQLGQAGFLEIELVASPLAQVEEALRVTEQVLRSREANPEYLARRQQFNREMSQRNYAQHQNRMAQLRANHNAHQARMRDIYAASDAQHQQFMTQLRSSGGSNSSDYSSHDALIDQIHERSTFNDPYSGQETHREGQYDHWYTDGMGEYYGTDDPSFDPNSLPGNWERIEPQRPDNW